MFELRVFRNISDTYMLYCFRHKRHSKRTTKTRTDLSNVQYLVNKRENNE